MADAALPLARSSSTGILIEDMYREILLRLPADRPKLLVRFAVVCPEWRRILADLAFHRRFRDFHALPPMIGYILNGVEGGHARASFVPTTTPPLCPLVPGNGDGLFALDSRHGRVLFYRDIGEGGGKEPFLIVWDPAGDHHEEVQLPDKFPTRFSFNAAVLCDVRDCNHQSCHGGPFRVVLVAVDGVPGGEWDTSALVYASESGAWTASPAGFAANANGNDDWGFQHEAPAALLGSALYFLTPFGRILQYEFGVEAERLAYVDVPAAYKGKKAWGAALMPAADGKLCLAAMHGDRSGARILLWETEVSDDGHVDWVEAARIPVEGGKLIGVAASRALFIRTPSQRVASFDLGSGRVLNVPKTESAQINTLVPFFSFYIPTGQQIMADCCRQ